MHRGGRWIGLWLCGAWGVFGSIPVRAQGAQAGFTSQAVVGGPVAPATATPGTLPLGTRVPITFLSDPPGYTLYRLLEGGVGAGIGSLGSASAGTHRRFQPLCTAPCRLTLTVGGHLLGFARGVGTPSWVSVEIPGPGVLRVYPHPFESGWRWYWRLLDKLARYVPPVLASVALFDAVASEEGEPEPLVFEEARPALATGGAILGVWVMYLLLVRPPTPYHVFYRQRVRWEPYATGP